MREQKYGGKLRIYPENSEKYVDVEPNMNRLLLFWSDRRNPHEVMPAFKHRYMTSLNPGEYLLQFNTQGFIVGMLSRFGFLTEMRERSLRRKRSWNKVISITSQDGQEKKIR